MRMELLHPPYEGEAGEAMGRWVPPDSGVDPLLMVRLLLRQHPALAEAVRPLGFFFAGPESTLDTRTRELVVVRVTARTGCEYEWGLRVAWQAEAAKFTSEQIADSVRPSVDRSLWDERDLALIDVVDELHDKGSIAEAGYRALRASYSDQQVVEILLLAGWYHAVSFLANGTELDPESFAARFPRD
jgi:4-carboxymuconolactone decarboxylase